jgi:4'-phosphopantetheinyl transferase
MTEFTSVRDDPAALIAWRRAKPPALHPGALHLWRIDADTIDDALVARCERILSPAELARGQRLRLTHLRRRFFLSHLASRQILGAYLNCAPEAIAFDYSPTGKPFIKAPATGLAFNLSTTGDLTLLAARLDEPVGVDAEIVRARVDPLAVAERMFGAAENRRLRQLGGEQQLLAFYTAWTEMEARVKRDGRGLAGHRERDAPDIRVAHARPRADAICAVASRDLPPLADWFTCDWWG